MLYVLKKSLIISTQLPILHKMGSTKNPKITLLGDFAASFEESENQNFF